MKSGGVEETDREKSESWSELSHAVQSGAASA
jgi:hypothetical protein